MNHDQIVNLLKESFPNSDIDLVDTVGDGNHWKLNISSSKFSGLSMIEQHRLVYSALKHAMKTDMIHAMSISTSVK